jgi:hypothetical protein
LINTTVSKEEEEEGRLDTWVSNLGRVQRTDIDILT